MMNDMIVMWFIVRNDLFVVEYYIGDNLVESVLLVFGSIVYFFENLNGLQYLYRVMLINLRLVVKYFYNVRGEKCDLFSDQFSFIIFEFNGK